MYNIGYAYKRQFTYTWYADLLRDSPAHTIKPYTVVRRESTDFVVSVHDTDLLRVEPGDVLTINAGGYHTTLVKSRLNTLLASYDLKVYQADGVWYLRTHTADYYLAEGIRLDGPTGVVLSGHPPEIGRPIRRGHRSQVLRDHGGRLEHLGQVGQVEHASGVENLPHLTE